MISDDELYKIIGTNVRLARERAGLSQQELAVAVGLSRTSITNIEAGQQKLQIHTLYKIGVLLHLTPHSFLPELSETSLRGASDLYATIEDQAEKEWIERIIKK